MDISDIEFGDWVELKDEETKKLYYFNIQSKEIVWEEPPDFALWKENCIVNYLKNTVWRIRENKGKTFYYNKATNKSTWDRPAELTNFESALQEYMHTKYYKESLQEDYIEDTYDTNKEDFSVGDVSPPYSPDFSSYNATQESYNDIYDEIEPSTSQPASPGASAKPIDTQYELQQLALKLCAHDAVMEPDILDTIDRYSSLSGTPPIEAIRKLVTGYIGYAQLAQITADWLGQVTSDNHSKRENDLTVDNLMATIMSDYILEKFNKATADNLINESSSVPTWLQEMFHVPVWRDLLIKLFDKHRGSVLLGYCLKQISAAGYHREIASVIREADYFQVINDLLVDVITRLSTVNFDKGDDLPSTLSDLCRMCCSSEYMFFYSQHLLQSIEDQLREREKRSREDDGFVWSSRIKRLRQEIEKPVIWKRTTSEDTVVPHAVGQQGEFSLRLTPLCSAEENAVLNVVIKIVKTQPVDDSTIVALAEIFLGIDSEYSQLEWSADKISCLLASRKHWHLLCLPQITAIFVHILVHNNEISKVTERIVFLLSASSAILQADDTQLLEKCQHAAKKIDVAVESCREMTALGYGLISATKTSELLELMEDPTVSTIVLHWLHHHGVESTFIFRSMHVMSFSFLEQLIVTAVDKHPLQWNRCLAVIKRVFTNAATAEKGKSSETIAIRQSMFDIIVHMIGKGHVTPCLKYMSDIVSVIDAGLIRHFVKSILTYCKPEYSAHFIVLFCDFLSHDSVRRALQSQHFAEENVKLLFSFMPYVLAEKLPVEVLERFKSTVSGAGKGQQGLLNS